MTREDLELIFTPHVGDATSQRLITQLGSAEEIFAMSYEDLCDTHGVKPNIARGICDHIGRDRAEEELYYCQRHGIDITCATDPHYPHLLREINGRPHILYSVGDRSILSGSLVSFVGSRKKTQYGDLATYKIIEELAGLVDNLVIVSGLAIGIDASAHRAALDLGIPTIGVIPNPLPEISPAQNKSLSEEILRRGGLILTEQSSGLKNISRTLIARNRIVVGISEGTIVVESGVSSGSMRSAEIAMAQGRALGAVPGRIFDSSSAGCNRLINVGDAKSISSGMEIVEMLGWHGRTHEGGASATGSATASTSRSLDLGDREVEVLRAFRSSDPESIDSLMTQCSLSGMELQGMLMTLELEGLVRGVQGGLYMRIISEEDIR